MQSGSELLSIAAKHPVPEVAQAISNAMTNAYMSEITERLESDQGRRLTELERAAQDAEQQLDELWAELNEVAIKLAPRFSVAHHTGRDPTASLSRLRSATEICSTSRA
ncbi:MAG: hypothetical protein R3C56_08205 [Pirellulaceae bacterium]